MTTLNVSDFNSSLLCYTLCLLITLYKILILNTHFKYSKMAQRLCQKLKNLNNSRLPVYHTRVQHCTADRGQHSSAERKYGGIPKQFESIIQFLCYVVFCMSIMFFCESGCSRRE